MGKTKKEMPEIMKKIAGCKTLGDISKATGLNYAEVKRWNWNNRSTCYDIYSGETEIITGFKTCDDQYLCLTNNMQEPCIKNFLKKENEIRGYFFEEEKETYVYSSQLRKIADNLDKTLYVNALNYYDKSSVRLKFEPHMLEKPEIKNGRTLKYSRMASNNHVAEIVWFEEDGTCWAAVIKMLIKWNEYLNANTKVVVSAPKMCNKFSSTPRTVLQDKEYLEKLAGPFLGLFARATGREISELLIKPEIEILVKAGFEIARPLGYQNGQLGDVSKYNTLIKPGKTPYEILQVPKEIAKALKDEKDVGVWDAIRKLNKVNGISVQSSIDFYGLGLKNNVMEQIRRILACTYENKPVFTMDSLMNYLRRLDMYEAIDSENAIILIRDYLSICEIAGIKPNIDSDSLKREHDVAVRTMNSRIDVKKKEAFSEKLKVNEAERMRYNFEDDNYFIRGVRDYDDLVDERNQQCNCVLSYANQIASGKSIIYFMRKKSCPDKSLITVELSMDHKFITQRFYAHNREVRNTAELGFLNKWLEYIKKVDEKIENNGTLCA